MPKKRKQTPSQKAKVQRQQATYKYYRQQGYSAKEASVMKGRTKQVWIDHYYTVREYKSFTKGLPEKDRPPAPKPPRIKRTVTMKKMDANEFIRYGINDLLASEWGHLKQDEINMLKFKMQRFFEVIRERTDDPDDIIKQFKKMIKKMQTDPDFWTWFQDFYMRKVGVVLNQH